MADDTHSEDVRRPFHVCIAGSDEALVSETVAALPDLLAGELGRVAAKIDGGLSAVGPDQDFTWPDFRPHGLPWAARATEVLARAAAALPARWTTVHARLAAARQAADKRTSEWLGRSYGVEITVSGSTVPSAIEAARHDSDVDLLIDLQAPLFSGAAPRGRLGVVRIVPADGGHDPRPSVYPLSPVGLTPGQVAAVVVAVARERLAIQGAAVGRAGDLVVSQKISGRSGLAALMTRRYLVNHLLGNWRRGAWREPLFLLSRLGTMLRDEGYSAGVLRAIYDQAHQEQRFFDRVFLGYQNHRELYNRLQILVRRIESVILARLGSGREVRVLTVPSGFAYDVFQPLERIAAWREGSMSRVRVVAADLDPHDVLADELEARAAGLGIRFQFVKGDLADRAVQASLDAGGPYDVVVFVGLSSWLAKPDLLRQLRRFRESIRDDGVLITDSFSPGYYAFTGWATGFRFHYYPAEIYRTILDYCGFDGELASTVTGAEHIIHVTAASPRLAGPEPTAVRAG
jgi:hypothetical protein